MRVLATTVVVLLMFVLTYFTFYTSNQANYFTNLNFRQLAGFSGEVALRIEVAGKALSAKAVQVKALNSKVTGKNDQEILPILEEVLKPLKTSYPSFEITRPSSNPKDSEAASENLPCNNLRVRADIVREQQSSWVKYEFSCQTDNKVLFQARVELKDLVGQLFGERNTEKLKGGDPEEGFDDLLIVRVNNQSEVIFEQGTPELNINSLDNLHRLDDPDKIFDFKTLSQSTNSGDVNLAGAGYKIYLQPLEIPFPPISNASTAPESMSTIQPAASPAVNSGSPKPSKTGAPSNKSSEPGNDREASRWVICGLTPVSHFRRQTWAISYTILIILAFLSSLIVLSWPFLKLLSIGPKDRLGVADVYFLAFSLLVGSALLTFFFLYGLSYRESEKKLDGQLAAFAAKIAENSTDEIDRAVDQLDALNRDPTVAAGIEDLSNREASDSQKRALQYHFTHGLEDHRPVSASDLLFKLLGTSIVGYICKSEQAPEKICDQQATPYPYFTNAFWTNSTGEQIFRWTIDSGAPEFVTVSDRDYFKEIMKGHYYSLKPGQRFWLAPVNSRITGAKTALISMPLGREKPKGISAIDASMMSLMQTVVPPGFGYRIIDDRGSVIFQSAESQQLQENFLIECDNDNRLRSLVFGRTNDFANIEYLGREYRLYVSPLEGFPNWSLIVFRDKQQFRTVYLEMITLAASLFVAYALLLLIFFSVVYLVKTNTAEQTEWIWPSRELSDIYYESFAFNLVLCLVTVGAIFVLNGRSMILLTSLIALIGFSVFIVRLKFKLRGKKLKTIGDALGLRKLFDYDRAYTANLVLLLLLAAVLPAVAFFKVSYDKETELYVKHGQFNMAKSLVEREARVTSKYSNLKTANPHNPQSSRNPELASALIQQRLDNRWDVYDKFFFETSWSQQKGSEFQASGGSGGEARDDWLAAFSEWMPFFNRTSIELAALSDQKAADNSWQWGGDAHDLTLSVPRMTDQAKLNSTLNIHSRLEAFGLPRPVWLFGVAVLLLVGVLCFLARFAVRKIFLLDPDTLRLPRIPPDGFSNPEQNFFMVVSSPSFERPVLPPIEFYRVDLKTEMQNENWLEKVKSKILHDKDRSTVVVADFEYRMNEYSVNKEKVDLIDYLLDANHRVIIISAAEPSDYSFDGKVEDSLKGIAKSPEEAADRWAEIVGRLMKVYYVDDREAEGFASRVDLSKYPKRTVKKTVGFVNEECKRRHFLQTIGTEILDQPKFADMGQDQILSQILDQATLYYQRIWQACSENEKLTLMHLAEDRLLSPNDPELQPLYSKGIIVRAPGIRLINESFREFVLSQNRTQLLESMETTARRSSAWQALKIPLMVILVGVVAFLFLTQKDFYNSTLTVVTAIATGIPAFFKLLSFFQNDRGGQKIQS